VLDTSRDKSAREVTKGLVSDVIFKPERESEGGMAGRGLRRSREVSDDHFIVTRGGKRPRGPLKSVLKKSLRRCTGKRWG